MSKAFDRIKRGLEEALAVAKGERKPARVTMVKAPKRWSQEMIEQWVDTTIRNLQGSYIVANGAREAGIRAVEDLDSHGDRKALFDALETELAKFCTKRNRHP